MYLDGINCGAPDGAPSIVFRSFSGIPPEDFPTREGCPILPICTMRQRGYEYRQYRTYRTYHRKENMGHTVMVYPI